MATHWTLGCDAAEPRRIAAFWAAALGYVDEPGYDDPDGASLIDPEGAGPAISFLRVPEPKTAKNRVHLDVGVSGGPEVAHDDRRPKVDAAVERLVGLGATMVRANISNWSMPAARTSVMISASPPSHVPPLREVARPRGVTRRRRRRSRRGTPGPSRRRRGP
jgi:hypothetical protein